MSEYHVLKAREQVQTFRASIEYLTHTWRHGRVTAITEEADGFTLTVSGGSERATDQNANRSPDRAPSSNRAPDRAPSPTTGETTSAAHPKATEPAGSPQPGPATATMTRPDPAPIAASEQIRAERLIIATGTTPRPLAVPGEREFFGRALGTSSISYSHLLRDRSVVVIGDSDRAIESAVECALQAERVTLVLEPHAEYSHSHLQLVQRQDAIQVLNGYRVLRFDGDTWARRVIVCRGTDGCATEHTIDADAFFVEREAIRNSDLVAPLLARGNRGEIRIDAENCTSNKRIFAAGDVTTVGIEQILVALGEGARAALSAYRQFTLQER
jgi:alkyl hydroperoxide reductase subunit F